MLDPMQMGVIPMAKEHEPTAAERREALLSGKPITMTAAVPAAAGGPKVRLPAAAGPAAVAPVDQAVVAAAVGAAMAALTAQRAANAPTPHMDRTVPGGLYLVEGVLVDAWGNAREDVEAESAKDVEAWFEERAAALAAEQAAKAEAAKDAAEQAEDAGPTKEELQAQANAEARATAAAEVQKRAEALSGKPADKDKDRR